MLRSINELNGYKIEGIDGEIGTVSDFYFDGMTWYILYLVGSSAQWLNSKPVLLPEFTLEKPDWKNRIFPVRIMKNIVEKSPDINLNKPISRDQEYNLAKYFEETYYKNVDFSKLNNETAGPHSNEGLIDELKSSNKSVSTRNIRSTREISGYHIFANDGQIGHVDDFIFEDDIWSIRYIVADTSNWLPGGKKVLIAIQWIEGIDWNEKFVSVDLSSVSVQKSPEYNPNEPINRDYEGRLFDYYGRLKYWL